MKNIVLKNAIIVDPSQNINSMGSIVIKDKIKVDGTVIRYLTVKYKKLDKETEFFKKK